MHKIVNGEVIELSAIEQEARSLEVAQGKADALEQAKEHLVAEVDRRLDQIFRDARLHNDKKRIRLATSIEEAKAVFAAIRWPLAGSAPETFVYRDDTRPSGGQVAREPAVVERVVEKQPIIERYENSYDDSWLAPQLQALTEKIDDTANTVAFEVRGIKGRLEEIENRPQFVHKIEHVQVPIEPSIKPGSFKELLSRASVGDEDLNEPIEFLTGDELRASQPIEIEPVPPQPLGVQIPPSQRGEEPPDDSRTTTSEVPVEQIVQLVMERFAASPTRDDAKPQQPLDGPPPLYGQIRYELAMMAVNEKQEAMILLQEEAKLRGMAVLTLAHKIIEERQKLEKEVARYYALQHA